MFPNCVYDPKKFRAGAMLLLSIGLLVGICGTEWPSVFAPHLHLSSGTNDFIRGFCSGLGITLEIVSLVALVLVCKCRNCPRTN